MSKWAYYNDSDEKPGSFPLADGAASRVVRLRGYGDAIVAPQAEAFIKAVMEELCQ